MSGAMSYASRHPDLLGMSDGRLRLELCSLTSMSETEWGDFFQLPREAQAIAVENYRSAVWAQAPDTLGRVLAVLEVLGTIAGVVSGVAGAASAVSALRAL